MVSKMIKTISHVVSLATLIAAMSAIWYYNNVFVPCEATLLESRLDGIAHSTDLEDIKVVLQAMVVGRGRECL